MLFAALTILSASWFRDRKQLDNLQHTEFFAFDDVTVAFLAGKCRISDKEEETCIL